MSYENAVPKPLKFLISDGKMIDDAGNVIAESETLKDLYRKWEPEVKKYLLSDGSVVDEEGNLIIKNDWWKSFYDGACPKVAKYLHADGTIDENPGTGGADLEDNHQTTIDVSTYTQPVEVRPEQGKDGMKKNTVTLTNIPSPSGNNVAYAYNNEDEGTIYLSTEIAPQTGEGNKYYDNNVYVETSGLISIYEGIINSRRTITSEDTYEKISDTAFTLNGVTYTRDSELDITFDIWPQ